MSTLRFWQRFLVAFATITMSIQSASALSDIPNREARMIFSSVSNAVQVGNEIYFVGQCSYAGVRSGSHVLFDGATGQILSQRNHELTGGILDFCPDGSGGGYAVGRVRLDNDVSINPQSVEWSIGRVNDLGDIDPIDGVIVQGTVNCAALSGETLFIGGNFALANGEERHNLAAFNTKTWELLDWNPGADGLVVCMAVRGDKVYAGGYFSLVGGQTRNHFAEISGVSGLVTDLIQDTDDRVMTMEVWGDLLLMGGHFGSVASEERQHLASIDLRSGELTAWNPSASFTVEDLAVHGSTLGVAGFFDQIAGEMRSGLAAFDLDSGELLPWHPETSWAATRVAMGDGVVYAEEVERYYRFSYAGSITARHMSDNGEKIWSTHTHGSLGALGVFGGNLSCGTAGVMLDGVYLNGSGVLDLETGAIRPWLDSRIRFMHGDVNAMVVSGSTVYLGGDFSFSAYPEEDLPNGLRGDHSLTSFDLESGEWLGLDLDFRNDGVFAMAISGSTIFLGGEFREVNGTTRHGAAAINAQTGDLLFWNPFGSYSAEVYDIAISGERIYLAGQFNHLQYGNSVGYLWNDLAAVDGTIGLDLGWHPPLTANTVYALEISGSTVYYGGYSLHHAQATRVTSIGAADGMTGEILAWDPGLAGSVEEIIAHDRWLCVSGGLEISGERVGSPRLVEADTGILTDWAPLHTQGIRLKMLSVGDRLFTWGDIYRVADRVQWGLAIFENIHTGLMFTGQSGVPTSSP